MGLVGTRREYLPVGSCAAVLAAHGPNKPIPDHMA